MAKERHFDADKLLSIHRLHHTPAFGRTLFQFLWCYCDDRGVHPVVNPDELSAELDPLTRGFSVDEIGQAIDDLLKRDLLAIFDADGKAYWYVTIWRSLIVVDEANPEIVHPCPPTCEDGWLCDANTPEALLPSGVRRRPGFGPIGYSVDDKSLLVPHQLEERAEFQAILRATGLDQREHGLHILVGTIVSLWGKFYKRAKQGVASGATAEWIDKTSARPGLAKALENAGWVVFKDDGAAFFPWTQ